MQYCPSNDLGRGLVYSDFIQGSSILETPLLTSFRVASRYLSGMKKLSALCSDLIFETKMALLQQWVYNPSSPLLAERYYWKIHFVELVAFLHRQGKTVKSYLQELYQR